MKVAFQHLGTDIQIRVVGLLIRPSCLIQSLKSRILNTRIELDVASAFACLKINERSLCHLDFEDESLVLILSFAVALRYALAFLPG